jgi:hypothetical protein
VFALEITARDFAPAAGHRRRALPEARRFQISLRSGCTAMLAGLRTSIQRGTGRLRRCLCPEPARMANTVSPSLTTYQDARLGLARQPRQRRLSVEEWEIAQILAVRLDQVEGVEDRGSSGLTTAQLLEA